MSITAKTQIIIAGSQFDLYAGRALDALAVQDVWQRREAGRIIRVIDQPMTGRVVYEVIATGGRIAATGSAATLADAAMAAARAA